MQPLLLTHTLTHTQQEAQAARMQTDGYELDRNHHFKVSMFDDFERYARVPDEYAAPEAKEYSPTVSAVTTAGRGVWMLQEPSRETSRELVFVGYQLAQLTSLFL